MKVLFPWKIGRLEFWGRAVILMAVATAADWLTGRPEVPAYWVWVWFTLYCVYGVIGIMTPRIRDVGLPPTRLFLLLVPFVNVWICIVLGFFPTNKSEVRAPNKSATANALDLT